MSAVDVWLDEATPDRREVTVCFDRRLVSELVQAKRDLDDARAEGMLGTDSSYGERVADLEAKIREKSRTFVFESIGWGPWRELLSKHPPEPDQAEAFERAVQLGFMPHSVRNVGYNAETFVPAAMTATCVEPGMTVQQAATILRKAPPGVIERLWSAVLESNLAGGDDPFVGPASAGSFDAAQPSTKK